MMIVACVHVMIEKKGLAAASVQDQAQAKVPHLTTQKVVPNAFDEFVRSFGCAAMSR